MGPALEALKALTSALKSMSEWARDHPETSKDIMVVVGALGALGTAAGTASGLIFVGMPLIGGLEALAGAVGGFASGGLAGIALAALIAGIAKLADIAGRYYQEHGPQIEEDLDRARRPPGSSVGAPNMPTYDFWVDSQGRRHDSTTGELLPDSIPYGRGRRDRDDDDVTQPAPAPSSSKGVTMPGKGANASPINIVIPPPPAQKTEVTSNIKLEVDGRVLAEIVNRVNANNQNGPATGSLLPGNRGPFSPYSVAYG